MATFIPSREAELNGWCRNFNEKITATPTAYGLVAAQATAFTALLDTWIACYEAMQNPVTRSPSSSAAKSAAKEAIIDGPGGIRQLVNIIQAHPGLTTQQRIDLRITVRDVEPTPVPVPTEAPNVEVVQNIGRSVTIRLHDGTPNKRAKPAGVKGATIFTFVGEQAPQDLGEWKFYTSTTKPNAVTVTFPLTVADGAKVWFAAFWFNPTSESGPLSEAVSTRLIGGLLQEAA